jgi:hypothetical protein
MLVKQLFVKQILDLNSIFIQVLFVLEVRKISTLALEMEEVLSSAPAYTTLGDTFW